MSILFRCSPVPAESLFDFLYKEKYRSWVPRCEIFKTLSRANSIDMGIMRFFYSFCLLTLLGLVVSSCAFDHLTAIQSEDTSAPSAEECGSCHVDQYSEWSQTAHARAFTSAEFKDQSDNYQDEDCLFCHVPGEVLNPERKARKYNLDEGVTCVSCHLYDQTMHGPHSSGALFSPHAIVKNSKVDSKLDSSQICGVCHEDTFEQWERQRKQQEYPTCHGCHGVAVKRPHTKGTNFFSKFLVSFEPEHSVRSHSIRLPDPSQSGIGPDVILDRIEGNTIHFILINSLPHDLPTGSFAEKDLFLQCKWQGDDNVAKQNKIVLNSVLAPGEKYLFTLPYPMEAAGRKLQLDLFRDDGNLQNIQLIHSYLFSLHSTRL